MKGKKKKKNEEEEKKERKRKEKKAWVFVNGSLGKLSRMHASFRFSSVFCLAGMFCRSFIFRNRVFSAPPHFAGNNEEKSV